MALSPPYEVVWDEEADALYIKLNDADIAYSAEAGDIDVAFDYDNANNLVGIDIQRISRRIRRQK